LIDEITFEPVESDRHVSETASLAREIWHEYFVPIIGRKQVDYMLEKFQSPEAISGQLDGGYDYYLVASDGRNAGYFAVVPNPDESSLMLSKLYVRKSDRGRGIGGKTLDFVEDLCRQSGIKLIWLTVYRLNTDSIGWYTKKGFVKVGARVEDIGKGFILDDYRMEKTVG